ncbi:MAG: DUF72 domain-containing protein [Thermodesulfobacteriota bacterium]|nr:DUF72 domain-containing protein [Thermodesulfobacteriota bacterium]
MTVHHPRILTGTCGYSYPEWKEAGFYCPDTPAAGMLAAYAGQFPVTELNYTWYQMPKAAAMERMRHKVPDTFLFSAKLTRKLTHEVAPGQWRREAALYREGVSPLVQAGQLAAVVVQFPPSFRRTPDNRHYLAALLDEMGDLPLAVEFRHASWATEKVYDAFAGRKVTLVTVDVPDLPWLYPWVDIVTNPEMFYVRFHGRNARGWGSGNMQHQFDYDYTDAELAAWADEKIPRMAEQARAGFLFFNNHVRAQAPKNAARLTRMLIRQGLVR